MNLLLDTHVGIWWDSDDARLGPTARQVIQSTETVYISTVSAWEISIKKSIGKLETSRSMADVAESSGFLILPMGLKEAEGVETLPFHHKDPFDRLLISTAREYSLTLVTADATFTNYNIATLDAQS